VYLQTNAVLSSKMLKQIDFTWKLQIDFLTEIPTAGAMGYFKPIKDGSTVHNSIGLPNLYSNNWILCASLSK
jgi:hypothetical protein